MTTISFVVCCKNEHQHLPGLVESLPLGLFQEKICLLDVDTREFHEAAKLAHALFERVHLVRFADSFGELITLATRLCAPADYALWLDCDEQLSGGKKLRDLFQSPDFRPRPMALPRRRWADWNRSRELEPGNRDWQARIVPTSSGRFHRPCHIVWDGPTPMENLDCGCVIDHFHDVVKNKIALEERRQLYLRLCVRAGISVEGGTLLEQKCSCGHSRVAHAGAFDYAKPPFGCSLCGCPSYTGGT